MKRLALAAIVAALLSFGGFGCASVDADQGRKNAVTPLVDDYTTRNPEQKQTWDDWLTSWQESIDARRNLWILGR